MEAKTYPPAAPAAHSGSRNLPEKKFRAGPVSATIWNNVGQSRTGELTAYKTVSLERVYKDKNGAWQNTNSLRVADLPRAVVALSKAYEHLILRETGEQGTDADLE